MFTVNKRSVQLFYDEGSSGIETGPLICSANQWTGFFMIETSVIEELKYLFMATKYEEVSIFVH